MGIEQKNRIFRSETLGSLQAFVPNGQESLIQEHYINRLNHLMSVAIDKPNLSQQLTDLLRRAFVSTISAMTELGIGHEASEILRKSQPKKIK